MIQTLLLALALAPPAQDPAGCPELVSAPQGGRLYTAASSAGQFVKLVGAEAWLLDGRNLSTRLVIPAGADSWRSAEFSDDGERLVLVGMRGTCTWVNVPEAAILAERPPLGGGTNVIGSADARGRRVVLQAGEQLSVLEFATGEVLLRRVVARAGAPFALAPDGTRVFYVGWKGLAASPLDGSDERVELGLEGPFLALRALEEDRVLTLRTDGVRVSSVAVGGAVAEVRWPEEEGWRFAGHVADPPRLALRGPGEALRVLDTADLSTAWELDGVGGVKLEAWSRSLWAARRNHRVTVHDLATGAARFELPADVHRGYAPDLVPALDGSLWLAQSDPFGLRRIDPATGRLGEDRATPTGDAREVGVLDDGTVWVLGARGTLSTIDERSGELLARVDAPEAAYAVSAGDRILVLADDEAVVHEGPELLDRGRFASTTRPILSPDGRRALVSVDGALRIVSTTSGELLATLAEGLGVPRRLAWDGEGGTVAVLDEKFRARLWRDGTELVLEAPLGSERSLAIDPEGRYLALGGGSDRALHLRVLDATNGRLLTDLPVAGWWPFGGSVRVLRFDPAGEFLAATMGDSGAIQVYRVGTWDEFWFHDYGGGNPGAIQVAFDPVAARLWASGMTNDTPAVYDLATGRVERRLARTGLTGFAVGGFDVEATTIAAIRGGTLVVLDADGTRRLEVLDLGPLGRVVADRSGEVRGPDSALRQAFVRVDGRVRPAHGEK